MLGTQSGGLLVLSLIVPLSAFAQTSPPPSPLAPPAPLPATLPVPVSPPASILIAPAATSIAADGTTAIVATLRKADGSLYDGPPVNVTFVSACGLANLSHLDDAVPSAGGIAAATYQANGCKGPDSITASLPAAPGLHATTTITVTTASALTPKATLGRAMFFDVGLSAAGNVACASCHAPSLNYESPNGTFVPVAGATGDVVGFRTAPEAAYTSLFPRFTWLQTPPNPNLPAGRLGTPRRGLMWDGRAATLADQAQGPFTGPHEMANADASAVLRKFLARPYVGDYAAIYGPVNAASDPAVVLANMADAISFFEREDKSLTPFSSKFDAIGAGLVTPTAQETNGAALFQDPAKGACAGCHNSLGAQQQAPGPQLFSDLSYRVLGIPRNWALPYNNDDQAVVAFNKIGLSSLMNGANLGSPNHRYFDLGVCGPFRTDSLLDPGLCGAFRVPSLRNVAIKRSYFHNGVFTALPQVINFYMTRDVNPALLYRKADGSPDVAFNDLPAIYLGNLERRPPFTPLRNGQPRLTASEVQDVITFLCTLTDGFDPQNPDAYRLPAQCRAAVRP